ncbi:GPR1/FUN34/YaaH family transporter [Bradyrhizobium sp.]|uniref:GPR1/FUN34/YaaH family transporter n=1 Tax=Bradyrhizobium sp. TaxID=376 RepID=UPI003C6ECB6C
MELRNEAAKRPVQGVWARGGPVFSHLGEDTVRGLEGHTIASFGDAASLGFWSSASGLGVTGLFEAGAIAVGQATMLFPTLLVYSGLVPFIAGLFLYRRNNAFLASAFCSLGALNLTRGLLLLVEAGGLLPQGRASDLLQGCMLESFGYVALSLSIAAWRINVVAMLMTGFAGLGYLLAGLSLLAGWTQTGRIGGYLMIASALAAFYGGTAVAVNTAWQREVLPILGEA